MTPSIFIDPLINHGWRLGPSCHCFVKVGTDLKLLHEFAGRIGMKRRWFQTPAGKLPHYDLTKSRRAAAVRAGAVELSREDAVAIFRAWRAWFAIGRVLGEVQS